MSYEGIKRGMEHNKNLLDEVKKITWFGHVSRMRDDSWPKKLKWVPTSKRRRRRDDINKTMKDRRLDEEGIQDRKLWNLGAGKHRYL